MLRPFRVVKALGAGLRLGLAAWRAPSAGVPGRHPRATSVAITLSDEAIKFARASDVLPPRDTLAKFLARSTRHSGQTVPAVMPR